MIEAIKRWHYFLNAPYSYPARSLFWDSLQPHRCPIEPLLTPWHGLYIFYRPTGEWLKWRSWQSKIIP